MMEMDSNPITKPSKKRERSFPSAFYALAVVLLITAFVSLAACHQNISRQLEQGVPVQGNELAIVNLYLTSCVQYFRPCRRHGVLRQGCPQGAGDSRAKRRYRSRPICSIPRQRLTGPDYAEEVEPEDDDTDFEAWGFRKRKNKKRHAGGLAEQQALGQS